MILNVNLAHGGSPLQLKTAHFMLCTVLVVQDFAGFCSKGSKGHVVYYIADAQERYIHSISSPDNFDFCYCKSSNY